MTSKYDYLFKLIVIGDTNTGKSCVLSRFTDDAFSNNFISTIGVDFKVKTINIDNKLIKIQCWDTAGQCRFRTITNSYYRGANGVIITYDITNKKSFDNIESWLTDVDKFSSDSAIRMLVGTKTDLTEKREVAIEEVELLATKLNISYIETSAKENINIEDIFINLSTELLAQKKNILESNKEKRIFIKKNLQKKDNTCC